MSIPIMTEPGRKTKLAKMSSQVTRGRAGSKLLCCGMNVSMKAADNSFSTIINLTSE